MIFVPDFKDDLSIENSNYRDYLLSFFDLMFKMDCIETDSSSVIFDTDKTGILNVVARESCIVAGIEEMCFLLEKSGFKILSNSADGTVVDGETVILEVEGPVNKLLSYERVILNFLSRSSSIATKSRKMSMVAEKFSNKVRILSTRKGLLSVIDKKSASVGGVLTHRLNLKDGIMIKDNHLKDFEFKDLGKLKSTKAKFYEFEFDSLQQFTEVEELLVPFMSENCCGVLLDNMPVTDLIKAIGYLNRIKNRSFFIEASGGITLENLSQYDLEGLDYVSSSDVFNYAKAVDLSAELEVK
jgi:nicotinate-nucleotide pyrophosphorylase (carboxylating)